VLQVGSQSYTINEVYIFDSAHQSWSTTTDRDAYFATAPPWSDQRWIFEGTERVATGSRALRMVYTSFGANGFRRDFQARQGAQWHTFTGETCNRIAD